MGVRINNSAETWQKTIIDIGLKIQQERQNNPILVSFAVIKPGAPPPRQLRFNF